MPPLAEDFYHEGTKTRRNTKKTCDWIQMEFRKDIRPLSEFVSRERQNVKSRVTIETLNAITGL
jgi:ribosomal protein S18